MATPYTVHEELKPADLKGITDAQIADHWNLYVGYVTQSNALKAELAEMRAASQGASPAYVDRRRRFGFEFCGMVLHEYYFGNLKAGETLNPMGDFAQAVSKAYGSLEAWQADFVNTGKSRGIGWAICGIDPQTGDINNFFVQMHEENNIPGTHPLVVMDVWEHAYMVDHKAGGRAAYIDAFFSNINWQVVENRYKNAVAKLSSVRF